MRIIAKIHRSRIKDQLRFIQLAGWPLLCNTHLHVASNLITALPSNGRQYNSSHPNKISQKNRQNNNYRQLLTRATLFLAAGGKRKFGLIFVESQLFSPWMHPIVVKTGAGAYLYVTFPSGNGKRGGKKVPLSEPRKSVLLSHFYAFNAFVSWRHFTASTFTRRRR